MMTKRQKERLLKLATFLRTVRNELFDLRHVIRVIDYDDYCGYNYNFKGLKKQVHNCGTTACAVGYVPVVFPRSYRYDPVQEIVCKKDKDAFYWTSIRNFFGLEEEGMDYLFQSSEYPNKRQGPKDVARRIEHFVKTGKITGNESKLI